MSAIFAGPQCPSCNAPLESETARSGVIQCMFCHTQFEGTQFQPRERRHDVVQVVTETPDGIAAACANHSRNAAVTNCSRCGLFICALCDLNVGEGSVCPSCFDRARGENAPGGGITRYRDYASMAASGVVFSLITCGFFPGAFAVYWGVRGIRQRRTEGQGIAGPVISIVLGSLETAGLLVWLTFMIIGMVAGAKS